MSTISSELPGIHVFTPSTHSAIRLLTRVLSAKEGAHFTFLCETEFSSILSAFKATKNRGYVIFEDESEHNNEGFADLTVGRGVDRVTFHIRGIGGVKSSYEQEIR